VIIGGVILRDKVPSESVEIGILLGLTATIVTMLAGFVFPNYTGFITLGVVPATATGTPLLDVSRVIGFAATIIGMLIGYIMHVVRR
jgi:vacuolar-type H+-ATPase subunit I/STV1